jgi:hypothetical protein
VAAEGLGAFSGNSAAFHPHRSVGTMPWPPRQRKSACPIPVALQPKTPGATNPTTATPWATGSPWPSPRRQHLRLGQSGSNSASETPNELNGHCGSKLGDTLGTPGVQASIVEIWNYRFGIYKNSSDPPSTGPTTPAISTHQHLEAGRSAYNGSSGSTPNFLAQRLAFTPCGNNARSAAAGRRFLLGCHLGPAPSLWRRPPHRDGAHRQPSRKVVDFACMLMLEPMTIPVNDVQLEYLGNASGGGSPCTTSGLAGGSAGPWSRPREVMPCAPTTVNKAWSWWSWR